MDAVNPYAAPEQAHGPVQLPAPGLRYGRAFGIVLITGALFAVGGAALGCAMGAIIPEYYRTVFSAGDSPSFHPVRVGFGLGLSQGGIVGLLVGCAVVIAVGISHRRRASQLKNA
jgi:hypothetical protein